MRLNLSEEADEDLRTIYLAGATQFGVEAADRYAEKLWRALTMIESYPQIARVREELGGEVRAYPVLSHIIVYKRLPDEVLVVRIRHGREDWTND